RTSSRSRTCSIEYPPRSSNLAEHEQVRTQNRRWRCQCREAAATTSDEPHGGPSCTDVHQANVSCGSNFEKLAVSITSLGYAPKDDIRGHRFLTFSAMNGRSWLSPQAGGHSLDVSRRSGSCAKLVARRP